MEDKSIQLKKKKKENPLISIGINILIPVLVLSKLSADERLGSVNALILALMFPLVYGILDFAKQKRIGIIPALGLINILLTGVVGLLELDPFWMVVKETSVPLVIGVAVIVSLKTPYPLVKTLLYNDQIIDKERVEYELKLKGTKELFEKRLVQATYYLSLSFFVSAVMNFIVTKAVIISQPGTVAFNEELAKLQWLSPIVIAGPSMIIMVIVLWFLIKNIKKLSGLEMNDILAIEDEKKLKDSEE